MDGVSVAIAGRFQAVLKPGEQLVRVTRIEGDATMSAHERAALLVCPRVRLWIMPRRPGLVGAAMIPRDVADE